jgi:hypothetical protein
MEMELLQARGTEPRIEVLNNVIIRPTTHDADVRNLGTILFTIRIF